MGGPERPPHIDDLEGPASTTVATRRMPLRLHSSKERIETPLRGGDEQQPAPAEDPALLTIRVGTALEEIERRVTMATLAACGNVKRRAAEILGISPKTLYNRLESYASQDGVAREVLEADRLSDEAQKGPADLAALGTPLAAAPRRPV